MLFNIIDSTITDLLTEFMLNPALSNNNVNSFILFRAFIFVYIKPFWVTLL